MKYRKIVKGIFKERLNRFIALVEVDGRVERCHVKNTGRCKELFISDRTVYLAVSDNPNRKTKYDLITVDKEGVFVNVDSQAPNTVFLEWAKEHIPKLSYIKGEVANGDSRFDFYYEAGGRKVYAEVKGVTLEENGVVRFPDAPTERGVKHLRGLMRLKKEGYDAEVIFVVLMERAAYFSPNDETHPQFGETLREAAASDVDVRAFVCHILPDEIRIKDEIAVKF